MNQEEKRRLARELWLQTINEGVKPHIEEIDRIAMGEGRIAVVVFNPHPQVLPYLHSLGWDGEKPVFALSDARARRQAADSAAQGDKISARWFRSTAKGRIYICSGLGSFLLNFDPEKGLYLEPGSTTEEFAKTLH